MDTTSIYGQFSDALSRYRTAKNSLAGLEEGTADYNRYKMLANSAKSDAWNAGISGSLGVFGGIGDIVSNAFISSHINDTPLYDYQINSINEIGTNRYNTFDQLAEGYNLSGGISDIDYNKIRGMSDTDKVGSVINSTASGAMTGLTVGGPWGALAGGILGLTGGLVGVIEGDNAATVRKNSLLADSAIASNNARINLNAETERLTDYNFRKALSHSIAKGGKIERKQMSIEEFAKRALSRPKMREHTVNTGFVREHCKGGTMIRFKK